VKPEFEIEIEDLDKEYTYTLLLRTTTDYKYNNLWVFMKTVTPEGVESRVPYEFRITNDDGSWIGTKTGTIVETPMTFPKRTMPQKGRYLFTIEQGITQNPIDEVLDLTLTVEEVKEEE
jgi:gliding motility-associated lipoprotein GldH